MKKSITFVIAAILASLSTASMSAELPSLAPGLNAEVSMFVQKTDDSTKDNISPSAAAFGSLFYTKPEAIDIGLEVAALGWGRGLFVTADLPLSADTSLIAGVGQLGYDVKSQYGDYYAHEPSLMLGAKYKYKSGYIVARYVLVESSKDHYITTSEETCFTPEHSEKKCETSSGTDKQQTDDKRQAFMVGFAFPLG